MLLLILMSQMDMTMMKIDKKWRGADADYDDKVDQSDWRTAAGNKIVMLLSCLHGHAPHNDVACQFHFVGSVVGEFVQQFQDRHLLNFLLGFLMMLTYYSVRVSRKTRKGFLFLVLQEDRRFEIQQRMILWSWRFRFEDTIRSRRCYNKHPVENVLPNVAEKVSQLAVAVEQQHLSCLVDFYFSLFVGSAGQRLDRPSFHRMFAYLLVFCAVLNSTLRAVSCSRFASHERSYW